MNKLWIVIRQTYKKNVFSFSFVAMVLGPIIMMLVIGLIGYFIGQDQMESTQGTIAIVDATEEIQTQIDQSGDMNDKVYDLSQTEAENALQDERIDGYLVFNEGDTGPVYYRYPTSKDVNLQGIETALTQYELAQISAELGLSNREFQALQNTEVAIQEISLQVADDGTVTQTDANDIQTVIKTGVAYVVSIVVFFFIMFYVGIISQEIAAEKGSRIMEIILSSISATQHFIGKIIGIILMIITQIVAYIILGMIAWFVASQAGWIDAIGSSLVNLILDSAGPIIWLGVIYAVLGIIIYTSLGGFLGSLVTRTEDVNKMITPIILTALAGFYIGLYAFASTNNPIVRIGSHFPLFTPFIMPFRIAADTVGSGEVVLSIIVSILFAIFSFWISIVFYKSNVLVYSDKGLINTLKQSIQLWRSEKQTRS